MSFEKGDIIMESDKLIAIIELLPSIPTWSYSYSVEVKLFRKASLSSLSLIRFQIHRYQNFIQVVYFLMGAFFSVSNHQFDIDLNGKEKFLLKNDFERILADIVKKVDSNFDKTEAIQKGGEVEIEMDEEEVWRNIIM
jgi:hypothetical protein